MLPTFARPALLLVAQCRSVQLGVASVLVFLNCGRARLESTYALDAALPLVWRRDLVRHPRQSAECLEDCQPPTQLLARAKSELHVPVQHDLGEAVDGDQSQPLARQSTLTHQSCGEHELLREQLETGEVASVRAEA